MTVISPRGALTAKHCDAPGSIDVGPDLSYIPGHYDPPYAPIAQPHPGQDVLLEGWGCTQRVWIFEALRRSVRFGKLLGISSWWGMELTIRGKVCGGDSGGAVWEDHGGLVGIITAYNNEFSYGTLIPSDVVGGSHGR
jgi:hypothetical protein